MPIVDLEVEFSNNCAVGDKSDSSMCDFSIYITR